MAKLPVLRGNKVLKAFSKAGWTAVRQKGSHVIMTKENLDVTLSVPVHKSKSVKRGTLRDLIKDADLTVEEFLMLI
jgi:predicted RNA binding protein YcfA (HicA-like mRNA interferase family)